MIRNARCTLLVAAAILGLSSRPLAAQTVSAEQRARCAALTGMTNLTGGVVDNERPIYAYPDHAVYSGPAGGQDDPRNWVSRNFRRR